MAVVNTGSLLEVCTTLSGMAAAAAGTGDGRPVASEDGRDSHVATFTATPAGAMESRGTSGGGPPEPTQLPSSLPLARGEPELISESLLSLFSLPLERPTTTPVVCRPSCRDEGLPAAAGTRVVVVAGALCTGGISSLILASGFSRSVARSSSVRRPNLPTRCGATGSPCRRLSLIHETAAASLGVAGSCYSSHHCSSTQHTKPIWKKLKII